MPGRPGANVAPVRDPGGKSGYRCMDMIGKVHLCTCTEKIEEFDRPRNQKQQQPNFGFHDTSKMCWMCGCTPGREEPIGKSFPPKNNL